MLMVSLLTLMLLKHGGSDTETIGFEEDITFEDPAEKEEPAPTAQTATRTAQNDTDSTVDEPEDGSLGFDGVEIDGAHDPDEDASFDALLDDEGDVNAESDSSSGTATAQSESNSVEGNESGRTSDQGTRSETEKSTNVSDRGDVSEDVTGTSETTEQATIAEPTGPASVGDVDPPEMTPQSRIRSPGEYIVNGLEELGEAAIWSITAVAAIVAFGIYCASIVMEWGASILLIFYGIALALILVDPSASSAAAMAAGSGRFAVAFELTIHVIPAIMGVFVVSMLIDKVLNGGQRYQKDLPFSRM